MTMTTTTRFGVLAAMAVVMVACGGQPGPALQQLQISPVVTEVTENLQANVVATAVYDDGTTQDVTDQVAWSTVDGAVASASAGVVQAGQPGRTYLTASFGGLQTSARVDVVAAALLSMWVDATVTSVPAGLTARAVASGAFSDGSIRDVSASAAWTSTREVVEVLAGGAIKGLRPGFTQVRATLGSLMAGVTLEVTDAELVSLAIAGVPASQPAGLATPFQVLATFTDGTTRDVSSQADVSVADDGVAALKGHTQLQGLLAGLTELRASFAGLTAAAPVQVTPVALAALTLACPHGHLPRGVLARFAAIGTFTDGASADVTAQVTWISSDVRLAVVSTYLMPGAILPYGAGTVTITAIDPATQVSASCDVVID